MRPFPWTRSARLETPSPGAGAFVVCWGFFYVWTRLRRVRDLF